MTKRGWVLMLTFYAGLTACVVMLSCSARTAGVDTSRRTAADTRSESEQKQEGAQSGPAVPGGHRQSQWAIGSTTVTGGALGSCGGLLVALAAAVMCAWRWRQVADRYRLSIHEAGEQAGYQTFCEGIVREVETPRKLASKADGIGRLAARRSGRGS